MQAPVQSEGPEGGGGHKHSERGCNLPPFCLAGGQVLEESQVALSFLEWLASATERIHQAMHYQFDGESFLPATPAFPCLLEGCLVEEDSREQRKTEPFSRSSQRLLTAAGHRLGRAPFGLLLPKATWRS